MPSEIDIPRLRAYYGAWVVKQILEKAHELVEWADKMREGIDTYPEHFQGRLDRERIDILVPNIHYLFRLIVIHHDQANIDRFDVDIRTIVLKYSLPQPLSSKARAYLGLQQEQTADGLVDAFQLVCRACGEFSELLFSPIFKDRRSFADYYFESEFFKPLADFYPS